VEISKILATIDFLDTGEANKIWEWTPHHHVR